MPPRSIDVIAVSGTHREVGAQLGEAGRDTIRANVESSWNSLPAGRTKAEQLSLAAEYRAFTVPRLGWLVDELDAVADAAGVDPLELFAVSIEEIWYAPRDRELIGRCSDLVAGPSATADGHLLVGHTNDLRPAAEEEITALEIAVDHEPVIFQLGGVPWLSVGWNSAGLSLTGNELAPNDERIGISRSHQVLEMMRATSLDQLVAISLRSDRASSYNNVLTSADGAIANVEGSATDAEITGYDDRDHFVHTNHYVCDRMLDYEGDPDYAKRSATRYGRGRALLAMQPRASITMDKMRTLLSDHETKPDSICRHPESAADEDASKTVFWCVADVTEGQIMYGRGNPCDSTAQEYVFASWPGR